MMRLVPVRSGVLLGLVATMITACIGNGDGIETADDFDTSKFAEATFAGGCFWCVDKAFEKLDGVEEAVTGYMGGDSVHKKHEQWKQAGYREVVRVYYDPQIVSFRELTEHHLRNIDPLDATGQFCDKGTSYLSAVYYETEAERNAAEIAFKSASAELESPVVTLLEPSTTFYPAVSHHQDYYKKYALKYDFTVSRCGRYKRLKELWGSSD